MPRANRFHIPGCVWHITHRCHKKDFLLRFIRDRRRWIRWLYEARKRYGLCILNYMVTSNHIHLLVMDREDEWTISRSMQLIAGRIAQEYNQRKQRRGAFWEDRYHATAIQSGKHLSQCMAYIDLNMVRAKVVRHPSEWDSCGYTAIQNPPPRYQVIDLDRTAELLKLSNVEQLARQQRLWVKTMLDGYRNARESKWVESIAVGDRSFVRNIMAELGMRARFREIGKQNGIFTLRECKSPYDTHFDPKNGHLSTKNTYKLDLTH